ncbi:MAG TPA: TonB family protein [Pyrinomonadaceae bacterium]|jgi:TonB family protein
MKKTLILLIVCLMVAAARAQTPSSDSAKADLQKTNSEVITLFQQKKYDEALAPAQKAVALTEQVFGKSSLEMARALRNLGFIQNARNDTRAAEAALEAAADIYKKIPDLDKQNGSTFAEMLETLGFIKFQKRVDLAESTYETALAWREKSDGVDSIKTARSLSALANISYWKKEYKKSTRLFQRVLDILIKNKANRTEEATLVYYRTECAFRKAEMQDELEPFKQKYAAEINLKTKDNSTKTGGDSAAQIIEKGVVNGRAVSLPKPAYPVEAKRLGAEGTVQVQVIIDEQGNVIYACAVKSDHFALNEASEIAASQAKFAPTILDGKPVRVLGTLTYNFRRG